MSENKYNVAGKTRQTSMSNSQKHYWLAL